MTSLREAAQAALEALEAVTTARCGGEDGMDISPINAAFDKAESAREALKAALAEPQEQCKGDPGDPGECEFNGGCMYACAKPEPLYAAPPQRPAEPVQEPVGNSYADLFNALQRIETAAVFLPSFKITHEGGLEAVVQNIVDAIAALAEPVQEPCTYKCET